MTRSDAPSTPWVDQPHDPTRLRRSFHLHGFTQRGRPEGRQTGQIVTGYLKSLGLEGASEIDRADILVIREDAVATVNHALISGFNGQEIWIVNSHAGLHRDYEQYRTKTLRHVPLPVMLSAVGRWLAKEVDTDTSRRIPNVPKSSGPAVSGSQISAEGPNASFDDERPRVRPWVLVVDDNVINRKILARNLAGMVSHFEDIVELNDCERC